MFVFVFEIFDLFLIIPLAAGLLSSAKFCGFTFAFLFYISNGEFDRFSQDRFHYCNECCACDVCMEFVAL